MTPRRRFIDTNVLLYSISLSEAEAGKRERAKAILSEGGCCLSVQVLSEFYTQSTRPTRASPLSHSIAADLIAGWGRFEVQDNTRGILLAALEIKERYGFSYWDCAVVAAARTLGCGELLTEDLNHGQTIDSVTIINPFR